MKLIEINENFPELLERCKLVHLTPLETQIVVKKPINYWSTGTYSNLGSKWARRATFEHFADFPIYQHILHNAIVFPTIQRNSYLASRHNFSLLYASASNFCSSNNSAPFLAALKSVGLGLGVCVTTWATYGRRLTFVVATVTFEEQLRWWDNSVFL